MRNLLNIMELDKMTKTQLVQLCEALYELLGERKAPVVFNFPALPLMDPLIPNLPSWPNTVPFYGDGPVSLMPKITCIDANQGLKV